MTSNAPAARTEDEAGVARWRRYERYAGILIATIVGVVLLATMAGDGADTATGRLGGDYPAFYGAGSIVLDGDIGDLYSSERQVAAQTDLLGEGDFLYFAYPPPVAIAYAPLAALPYRLSYLIHTILMLGALVATIRLLRPVVPAIDHYPRIATLTALTFYPMFRAVTGGQNTALTALLIALVMRLDRDDRPFAAGLAAALLLYKPQFGLPVAALLMLPPRWAMLKGWIIGAGGFYAVAAISMGPGWIRPWWNDATSFAEINEGVNGFLFISLPGMLANWFGSQEGAGRLVWMVAVLIALGVVVYTWLRIADVPLRWSLTALAVVLLLPQALYYEAGIALLGVATLGVAGPVVAVIWVLSWTQVSADALNWSPLGIITPALFVWMLVRARTTESKTS